jgi:hypothetical protein
MRSMIIAGSVVAAALIPSAASADPSVVDAYEALRASGVAPDLTYALEMDAGQWVTTSPDWGTPIPVLVDGSNGYVEILDEGTGGGSFETQIVLWRKADGAPLLGIAETAHLQPGMGASHVRFFESYAGRWEDLTGYVWPQVDLTDFMTDQMSVADLRDLTAIGASVYVDLPQHGLNAEARLTVPDELVRAVCDGEDWFVPADKEPYLRYCRNLSGALYRTMSVRWDRAEGRFFEGPRGR